MSLEKLASCPVCGSKSFTPFLICLDHTTTGESFHVEQCVQCHLLATTPRPTETDAARYYQSAKYISHTSASQGFVDRIYLLVRHFTLKWKYSLVKKYIKTNTILDFGAGTGHFLDYCLSKKINAYGIEPSDAKKNHPRIKDSLDQIPLKRFDVITMWHVLEHVYKLDDTLSALKNLLTNSGTIFIAVPNWQSYDSTFYKNHWAAFDVPRHLWHFSQKNMTRLLEQNGFKVLDVIPMKLDAYYVSQLSEKYQNNGRLTLSRLLRAMRVAFSSNLKAKTDRNYSSLIYVAGK